jgi:hypothetical protein
MNHMRYISTILLITSLACLCLPFIALAAEGSILGTLGNAGEGMGTAEKGGTPVNSVPVIIGKVIRVIILALGVILLIYLIYGGILYMTAGGSPEQVTKAKNMLGQAIIGVAIILLAYAIASFVISRLAGATVGA